MSLVNGQYRVPFFVIQKLTDTGFETIGAQTNFNEDYSVTPKNAIIQAPPGVTLLIDSLNISVTDSGIFAATDYGNIVGGLSVGIRLAIVLNGVEFSNPAAVFNDNAELFSTDSGAQIVTYAGNERTLVARFGVTTPVVLNGNTNDKLMFVLNDDMSGLEIHEFVAYGRF